MSRRPWERNSKNDSADGHGTPAPESLRRNQQPERERNASRMKSALSPNMPRDRASFARSHAAKRYRRFDPRRPRLTDARLTVKHASPEYHSGPQPRASPRRRWYSINELPFAAIPFFTSNGPRAVAPRDNISRMIITGQGGARWLRLFTAARNGAINIVSFERATGNLKGHGSTCN